MLLENSNLISAYSIRLSVDAILMAFLAFQYSVFGRIPGRAWQKTTFSVVFLILVALCVDIWRVSLRIWDNPWSLFMCCVYGTTVYVGLCFVFFATPQIAWDLISKGFIRISGFKKKSNLFED